MEKLFTENKVKDKLNNSYIFFILKINILFLREIVVH